MLRLSFLLICFSYISLSGQGNPLFIEIASGLSRPVVITNAGDQSSRLFIVEQAGRIKIMNMPSSSIAATPFLDISSMVQDGADEQGLLGLAFHPEYKSNGYFYVYYIVGGLQDRTRISRFSVSSFNPNVANPNSELVLLEYSQPFTNHNGGDLQFGPDGYLYIASGDGGSSNDPQGNAQNTSTLLGAILRIDVDTPTALSNYSIPSDNPFGNEIWFHGLRNPWRFSFDAANGDMYIADVGQNAREEVNVVTSNEPVLANVGINLGWDCREGFINSSGCIGNFHDPIFDYNHNFFSGGFSVTGGFVYRGNSFPNFEGWYFFIDYVSERLWQTKGTSATGLQVETSVVSNVNTISSFGQSEAGELYALSLGFDVSDGKAYRIIDQDDCELTMDIPSVTSSQDYDARNLITSNAVLPANVVVSYGSQEIILNSPFTVPLTTQFHAEIGICGSW